MSMLSLCFLIGHFWLISCQGHDFQIRSPDSSTLPLKYTNPKQPAPDSHSDDFSSMHDLDSSSRLSMNSDREAFFDDVGHQFRDYKKKSGSRPKYDPGWKFIGLGKRPEDDDLRFSPEFYNEKDRVNPLLGISTLINFEFINALRNNMQDETKDTVKKESVESSRGDEGSYRFGKMNAFRSQQKAMYDPGWMLTGLGK